QRCFASSSACPQELAADTAASTNGEFMTRPQLTVTSSSSSSSAFPFFVIWTASGSRTRIETCFPRNSTGPSAGETQRSKAGLPPLSPTVTLTYVLLIGRIATRFCSLDCADDALVVSCVFPSSSRVTGFARRTSGSLGPAEAAKAFRVSGGPAVATGEVAATGGAEAATVAAHATLPGDTSVVPDCTAFALATGDALGDNCAVDAAFPGASRCTLRISFITEKPITNTSTPKI